MLKWQYSSFQGVFALIQRKARPAQPVAAIYDEGEDKDSRESPSDDELYVAGHGVTSQHKVR